MLKRNKMLERAAIYGTLLFQFQNPCVLRAQQPLRLIAHRGGIVDCHHPEDSPGAAKEAIRKGYWMLEVDLQETRDGHIVVHHDDFQKSFGVLKLPAQMSWDEIRHLRAVEDHSHPMDLSQLAALCRNKVRLMVDIKPPHHSEDFYELVERTLRENGLLQDAYFIGTPEARSYFKGKALISISANELRKQLEAGKTVSADYFLFEHGSTLSQESIQLANRVRIPLVVTINDDHYAGRDHMIAAHDDIVRARQLGVTYFQIDSDYDVWLK